MTVDLTPDQKALVRDAIASGRLRGVEDAIRKAMALWERRERARAEILASVDAAEAALARGEGRVMTQESMRVLATEVKQRARASQRSRRLRPEAHRLAPGAEVELDEIWFLTAKESGSVEIADRLIDSLTNRAVLYAWPPSACGPAARL